MVVGLPILAGVLTLGGCIGVVEVGLLGRLRGQDTSITLADPRELPVIEWLKTVATAASNYLLIGFGFVSFVVGIPLFVAITIVFAIGFTLAATPSSTGYPVSNKISQASVAPSRSGR
ncbi:MAG: putative sensor [uncultured archaeon A07HR67]|jgi:hypothetical protein|nr:MAG: putative sensor [uncultured archaeon A07HR67]